MFFPRKFADSKPEKPAYIMTGSGEVVTFQQLEDRANQCAHLFRNLGLKQGDNVAICMENNAYYLILTWAAQRAGLYYTPISTHLTTGEAEYIINNCDAKVFVTSHVKKDLAAELTGKIPNVIAPLMLYGTIGRYQSYEHLVANLPTTPIADEAEGQDMLYSSGTTGLPKGVVPPFLGRPIGEISDGAKLLIQLYGLNENAVYLSPAPLYHSAPLRFSMITTRMGGTVIVMEKFDAEVALAMVEKYKVTTSQWVPTMFIRMLKLPEELRKKYDVSTLKTAVHAAAPCPIPVKEQMIEWWGPILYEYYAGTEGNGITAISSQEWLSHKGSVGKAVLGVTRIVDEEGNELPPGEPGIIYFADGVPFEYHKDAEKTAESRNGKGWTTLGDIGYLDEEGYLYLTDRKSNMIISGGVNIYPQESENLLVTHPKVLDAAVIGVPNPEFGEEVKAVIQLRNPSEAGAEMEEQLIAFCQKHLAKIKCPVSVDFVEELPRTPTGKLFKRLLREKYWKEHKTSTGAVI